MSTSKKWTTKPSCFLRGDFIHFLFHLCASCLVATPNHCLAKDCSAKSATDEVVQKMQSLDSASELGEVYWNLFQNYSSEQLTQLKSHSNHGVAIQACWEQLRRAIGALPPKVKSDVDWELVNPKILLRFLGFIEGRLHLTVPRKWENEMLLATAIPGDPLSLAPGSAPRSEGPTPYYDTNIGLQTSIVLRLHEADDAIIITRVSDNEVFQIPKAILNVATKEYQFLFEPSLYGGPTGEMRKINLIDSDKKYFVAYHGIQHDGRYPLFCLKKDDSKLEWTTEVICFEGGGGLTGANFYHWTEMRVTEDHVLVFGAGHISMYIEAFSIADGACLFRFNTSYGEDEGS